MLRFLTKEQKLDLAREAMQMAIDARYRTGQGLENPVCAYTVCEHLGTPARFVDVSMEGLFRRLPSPRIILSSKRPLVRRHFNCAHELGHFLFDHGSTFHELQNSIKLHNEETPEEYLVNSFAGHFLMPIFGVRNAFARRKIKPRDLTPEQAIVVASEFSVGYETLLTHLAFAIGDISEFQKEQLGKFRGKLRKQLVPASVKGAGGLTVLDLHFNMPNADIEVGHLLIAPTGTKANCDAVTILGETELGPLFQATKRGSVELYKPQTSWAVHLRIAKKEFVGLAKYRFLEDDDEDE